MSGAVRPRRFPGTELVRLIEPTSRRKHRMRFVLQIGRLALCCLVWHSVLAQSAPPSSAPLATLTTAHAAHSLATQQAARSYPVHLHAVVTYFDPYIDARHDALFVQDQTGGIFIRVASSPPDLHAGDLVEIVGVSAPGDYAPIVDRARIRIEGKSHVPASATRVTLAELLSGAFDGQWVEIAGVVHVVHLTEHNVTIDVGTAEGSVSATTLRVPAVDYNALTDAVIQLDGNAGPEFNRKRQMVGVHLFFPTLGQLHVLQPAPPDPYATPLHPISQLLQFTPGFEFNHRTRVRGTVTLDWPGRMLCIEEASDGLCMPTAQSTSIRSGRVVDVIGFPTISQYKVTLENARFQVEEGSTSALVAKPITAQAILREDHDGELVQVQGELIGQDRATGDLTLMLRSGKLFYPAILPGYGTGDSPSTWKDGSRLRLTGVANVQVDSESTNRGEGGVRPRSFQILMRSPDDVEILDVPSWLTRDHVVGILAAVLLIGCVAIAWIVVLRRRVEAQTRALRESEERLRHMSHHDALTGLPNRVLFNDRLDVALKRSERFKTSLAVLMLDVDCFKRVNDTLGHHAGDRLLREIATRIRRSVRKTDTVARFGGDEFVVLLTDLHEPSEATAIASIISAEVSMPLAVDAGTVPVTVSIGICPFPAGGTDPESLLQHADEAMYIAKSSGRNCCQLYIPGEMANLHA
jgi:diguanylate cyclase (GGDEF)-like protein